MPSALGTLPTAPRPLAPPARDSHGAPVPWRPLLATPTAPRPLAPPARDTHGAPSLGAPLLATPTAPRPLAPPARDAHGAPSLGAPYPRHPRPLAPPYSRRPRPPALALAAPRLLPFAPCDALDRRRPSRTPPTSATRCPCQPATRVATPATDAPRRPRPPRPATLDFPLHTIPSYPHPSLLLWLIPPPPLIRTFVFIFPILPPPVADPSLLILTFSPHLSFSPSPLLLWLLSPPPASWLPTPCQLT
ncbi:unnamed protein product [Closterium sp. Naga37s-1]|nr:unnamed protein product [Closterium sp. Naga37s-1]